MAASGMTPLTPWMTGDHGHFHDRACGADQASVGARVLQAHGGANGHGSLRSKAPYAHGGGVHRDYGDADVILHHACDHVHVFR